MRYSGVQLYLNHYLLSFFFFILLFSRPGVDESVLNELKNIWQSKLTASKVLESESPLPSTNDPMIAGPYLALQQQHNSANTTHPGYQPRHQERQSNARQPPVSVNECG